MAIIEMYGDVDGALALAGIGEVAVGAVVVRDLCGVDRGVVARWSAASASLMPHGGVGVVRALAEALTRRGVAARDADDWRLTYPEAADELEARMLAALARAASPLAVDLLLDQPRRWRAGAREEEAPIAARSRVLNRLIDPPMVVVFGPANVGKSTLLNALAGRAVAVVADEPGTTRDHVGVLIDLGGLVVRYVDTPGIRHGGGEEEQRAICAARALATHADLVVAMADATGDLVEVPAGAMRVGLRADLGPAKGSVDISVSVRRGEGVPALVAALRERLVPRAVLDDPGVWRFW